MSLLDDFETDSADDSGTRKHHRLRNAIIGALCCLLVLLMIPFGAFLFLEHRLSSNIDRLPGVFAGLDHRPAKPLGPAGQAVNILLVGTDRRSPVATTGSDARATDWVVGAQRSDALMILHISSDRQSATIVSIPRDTWVNIPGYGMGKINAAFSYGGASLAVQTVESFTGVRIDHLAVVDWTGFAALIDSVGGIEVTVPQTVTDSVRGITWDAGEHHLDGAQALDYVGQRYGLPRGDLDRVARQQVVLRTLMQDALHQEMRKDPRMLYDFLETITQHLSVDSDWSTTDMLSLIVSMRSFRSANISYLTMPVAGFGRQGGQSVVYADRRAASSLWGAVIGDEVSAWETDHQRRLTPSVVS